MSYDEKVQKLLEVAGDYNTVTAGFSLEATLYTQMCKIARDKVKQTIEALSLGTIHLTIDANNYLTVCVDELNVSRSAFFDIFHLFAYDLELLHAPPVQSAQKSLHQSRKR